MTSTFNTVKKFANFEKNFKGKKADNSPNYVRSYLVELSSSQDVVDGEPLKLGTDPETQVTPYVKGDSLLAHNFAGFKLNDPSKEIPNTGAQYADGDAVDVMAYGTLVVSASEDVTGGERVTVTVNGGDLGGAHQTGSLATGTFFAGESLWLDSVSQGGIGHIFVKALGSTTSSQ